VRVNERDIGQHQGVSDAIRVRRITDMPCTMESAEEIVHWRLRIPGTRQPRGKQSRKPEGIFYTSSSGIWQTVWLELSAGNVQWTGLKSHRRCWMPNRSVFAQPSIDLPRTSGCRSRGFGLCRREPARVAGRPIPKLVLTPAHPIFASDRGYFRFFFNDLKVTLQNDEQEPRLRTSISALEKSRSQGRSRVHPDDGSMINSIFEVGNLDQGFLAAVEL